MQRRVRDLGEQRALWRATKVLSGTHPVQLADDECCAVTLVKNGAYYLPALLEHHRAIGVSHFLIIDNGSTDGSIERLAAEPDVTVIENRLPVSYYEVLFRSLLPRRFVQGGWFLTVDSDEMFDPPPGCDGSIRPLLRYLVENRYTALLAHALDMFSDAPAEVTKGWSYEEALDKLCLYSLSHLERIDYHDPNFELSFFLRENQTDAPMHFWQGGMRQEVFGERPLLTRHNIIRNAPGVGTEAHVHAVSDVRVADVTASFRHYKFAGEYMGRDRRQMAERVWHHGEDDRRVAIYDQKQGFAISTPKQQVYRNAEALLDQGFIQTSPRFQAFLERERTKGADGPGRSRQTSVT